MKLNKVVWMAIVMAGVASAIQVDAFDPAGRIYAEPLGSTQVDNMHTIENVALILNNTEDRVGARAKLCQSYSDSPCERMMFNFPQLHLDKDRNVILLNDKPVAQLQRHGMRVNINKEYHLGYDIASITTDTGFDKNKGKQLRVYLEPLGVAEKK